MELKIKSKIKSRNNLSLINAVKDNKYDEVLRLCGKYPELIDIVDEYNHSPLLYAVYQNNYNIVALLCEKKPELISVVDNYNNSPLLYAVNQDNYDIVALLCSRSQQLSIEKEVNISEYTSIPGIINREKRYNSKIIPGKNIEYNSLVTPLMLAVIKKNIHIIRILIINTSVNYRHIAEQRCGLKKKNNNHTLSTNCGVNALYYAVKSFIDDLKTFKKNFNPYLHMRIIETLLINGTSPLDFMCYETPSNISNNNISNNNELTSHNISNNNELTSLYNICYTSIVNYIGSHEDIYNGNFNGTNDIGNLVILLNTYIDRSRHKKGVAKKIRPLSITPSQNLPRHSSLIRNKSPIRNK